MQQTVKTSDELIRHLRALAENPSTPRHVKEQVADAIEHIKDRRIDDLSHLVYNVRPATFVDNINPCNLPDVGHSWAIDDSGEMGLSYDGALRLLMEQAPECIAPNELEVCASVENRDAIILFLRWAL